MKNISRNRFFLSALAACALWAALPVNVFAAPQCLADWQPLTSERRGALWQGSIQSFAARHPNLSKEQAQLLTEAAQLSRLLSKDRAVAQGRVARPLADFVREAHTLFSTSELGEIFASMGKVQTWLVENAALATPYCNCSGSGPCVFPGGPTGSCEAGCISWDPTSGTGEETEDRYDGLCGGGSVE